METKVCKKCEVEKDFCEFDIRKTSKDGLNNRCKECRRNYFNQYNSMNRDKKNEQHKKYYYSNRDKELVRNRLKHEKNKEKEIEYRKNNRNKINEREKNRYNNDVLYKIKTNMRNRLRLFLKSKKIYKTNTTLNLVGGTPEIIKEHLESQFTDGMSWDNHGEWHIDHKIPLSSAKTEEEVYQLAHYSNLQPLWAEENLKKSNKLL
jgi:hypothetical protein